MTKANQVAPLLATLRGLIPDATEAIDEFAKLAKYVDEVEARAEQAEYSLAASERALAALRYQAQAGGCELSTVGEDSYHCRADAPCGLCRLRHRAEQAERDRDAWREKWEALETTRAVCCAQMERERDEARAERDAAVDRLVGARVARESAFEDADDLRAELAKTERVVEAAREDAQHCPHACSPPCPFDRAVARTRAALRALDSPVVAGTDSGGASGAATPEGGHAAPTGGPMPPPEPAGSSLEATRDLQAPATRAELEALRVRVERLEQLAGFVPKE